MKAFLYDVLKYVVGVPLIAIGQTIKHLKDAADQALGIPLIVTSQAMAGPGRGVVAGDAIQGAGNHIEARCSQVADYRRLAEEAVLKKKNDRLLRTQEKAALIAEITKVIKQRHLDALRQKVDLQVCRAQAVDANRGSPASAMNPAIPKQRITRTPAPFLAGLYSVHAMSDKPGLPDITIYRKSADDAISWKDAQVGTGRFSRYLLRADLDTWDVFDAAGRLESHCGDAVYGQALEVNKVVIVNREQLEASVAYSLGRHVTCLVRAECHAGASSVEHSNFAVLCRLMIAEASAKDLKHMYIVESRDSGCRVTGIYMRMHRLSTEMSDKYLDRYKWLSQGWPLSNPHHAGVLAARLSIVQCEHLTGLVSEALKRANFKPDISTSASLAIMSAPQDARHRLAEKVVEALYPGLVIAQPGALETFSEEAWQGATPAIIAACRSIGKRA